jgi:uncharacterized SAM-binding protein YcdF (DUF218 family)
MRPLLVAVLLLTGCYRVNRAISDGLIARDSGPAHCDAIVVPGCPARPDGTPSTCIQRRVRAAVDAFREGAAPLLLFSGGAVHNKIVEAQVMADFARSLGVPDGAMLVEPRARHTTENLQYAAYLLLPRDRKRILLITDVTQMPFAEALGESVGFEVRARLAHPDVPKREIRKILKLDRWEPTKWMWR